MSNDKPVLQAQPPRAEQRQSIPISSLRFYRPTDLPGKTGATSVSTSTQQNKGRHTIVREPWERSFSVTFTPPIGASETWSIGEWNVASWIKAPQ